MEKIVNLTPHDVVVLQNGVQTSYPSQGVARVEEQLKLVGYFDGVAEFEATYGDITGLPEPQNGVIYIVSGQLKNAAKELGRKDTRSPARQIRDPATGHVLYAEGLLR